MLAVKCLVENSFHDFQLFYFRELAHLEENSEEYVSSIEWIDHGNLAFGDSRNRVQIWDVESGKALRKIRGHASRVSSLAVGKGDQEMVKKFQS